MSITPVGFIGAAGAPAAPSVVRPPTAAESPFARLVEDAVGHVNSLEHQADQAVQELATGRAEDVHSVILSVAKADLMFRLLLEIRNRLTDGFQEVLRMQV